MTATTGSPTSSTIAMPPEERRACHGEDPGSAGVFSHPAAWLVQVATTDRATGTTGGRAPRRPERGGAASACASAAERRSFPGGSRDRDRRGHRAAHGGDAV